ncbi:MAG: glycosyltransferase, partial [Limisphaerales bacterium]
MAVIGGLAKAYGGPSYSAAALSRALHAFQVERVLVPGFSKPLSGEDLAEHPEARVERIGTFTLGRAGVGWSPFFKSRLNALCRERAVRLLHLHGIWLSAGHDAASVARRTGIPLIVTPHVMLRGWAMKQKRLKKRLAWWLYQARDLQSARVLHATAEEEAKEIRKIGLQNPIAIVPHGVEVPPRVREARNETHPRTVVFMSRIHPQKGLPQLVRAWSRLKTAGWRVVIAGPDEGGHQREVESLISSCGLRGSFSFIGRVGGDAKWNLLHSSDLFVLPSFGENFGLVIPEALACGLPVVTTTGTPWQELVKRHCGWWIDTGAEPLAAALGEAISLSD